MPEDYISIPEDAFEQIKPRLAIGWICALISNATPGIIRLQLMDDGEEELGWRKCVEARSFDQALAEAERFTHSITVAEYHERHWRTMDAEG